MNYSDSENNITDFVILAPEPEFTVSQMIGYFMEIRTKSLQMVFQNL